MLFILIIFPVVLSIAFGAAFGGLGAGNGNQTYEVGVVDYDNSTWSSRFMGNLSATEVLNIQEFPDNNSAQEKLQTGRLAAVVLIPANFGISIEYYLGNQTDPSMWLNITVGLFVDQGSLVAKNVIRPVIQQTLLTTIFGSQASQPTSILIGDPKLVAALNLTEFDYMVPGLFAFAIIFIGMTVATAVVGEREQRLLRRISVTPTTSGDVITSHLISSTTMAMIQVGLVFLIATLMGFRSVGSVEQVLFAFLIMAVFALCNVGFGLIVASIAKNSGAATGYAMIFILLEMFLGTFVPVPQEVSMFVPSYYATDALTSLFVRGAPVTSPVIWTDFGIVCAFAIGIIALGVILYKKLGTR